MPKRGTNKSVFDPRLGHLVSEYETSSARIRTKLRDYYTWGFCELCWRATEYAIATEARKVYKRLLKGNARAVPLTQTLRDRAQKEADTLVARYEEVRQGAGGRYEASRMISAYCVFHEMRHDYSAEAFRDQVERYTLLAMWARHGDLISAATLPGQPEGAAKPSKLYCEAHNPRRSAEARRAYQRDRRYKILYEQFIEDIWREGLLTLPRWDIEAHAAVRKEAYERIQRGKSITAGVAHLLGEGTTNLSEIARQLGVTRQAVSSAARRVKPAGQQTVDDKNTLTNCRQ